MTSTQTPVGDLTGNIRPTTPLAQRLPSDTPPPYPHGWYAAAFLTELPRGTLLTRTFMGRDIIVYRTESGVLRAAEAYCPHLGAHLGAGRICAEAVECPFHSFRFGIDGTCVDTPYTSPPPPSARLSMLPVRECWGVAMVYHGLPGEPPWEIETPDDDGGWRPLQQKKLRFRSHPQEVTENAVDYGHFNGVHAMTGFEVIEPLRIDGPRMRMIYSAFKPLPLLPSIPGRFDIRVDGLGYSIVEVTLRGTWTFRQIVLTTPTTGRDVDVHLAVSVRRRARSRLGSALMAPVDRVFGYTALRMIITELDRDQAVWNRKKYLARPALAGGDGPIGAYRRWARQFYPEQDHVIPGE